MYKYFKFCCTFEKLQDNNTNNKKNLPFTLKFNQKRFVTSLTYFITAVFFITFSSITDFKLLCLTVLFLVVFQIFNCLIGKTNCNTNKLLLNKISDY